MGNEIPDTPLLAEAWEKSQTLLEARLQGLDEAILVLQTYKDQLTKVMIKGRHRDGY